MARFTEVPSSEGGKRGGFKGARARAREGWGGERERFFELLKHEREERKRGGGGGKGKEKHSTLKGEQRALPL